MDTQQISYFLKVAETEHMTNAARELYVSQPALSRSLRMLEEELGMKLFDRLGRRLVLNDNGRRFYAYAAQFQRGVSELRHRNQTNESITGELSVDIRIENTAVMQAVVDFCQRFPSIRVQAVSTSVVNPEQQCDFIISAYNPLFSPVAPSGLALFEEPYMLAVPELFPLAQKESVSCSEAKELPFVLPLPDQELTRIIQAYCQKAGFRPICRVETNSYQIAFSLVEQEKCVALVPKFAPGLKDYPHIRLLPLKEQSFRRTIFMQRLEETPSQAMETFQTFLMEQLRRPF